MEPTFVTLPDLARLWNLTDQRIYQFVKEGRLKRMPDGTFNLQDALAFRKAVLADHEVEALFQHYHTSAGLHPPKILAHVTPQLTDDEVLGIEPAPLTAQEVTLDAVNKHANLTAIRAAAEQVKLDRLRRHDQREAGRLIERQTVYRTSREASAEIMTMLRGLPHDVAALFPDHETRSEVREKVERLVERVQFALFKKFDGLARSLDDEDDDF